MLQKESVFVPSNKCGVWLVKVIHTYSKLAYINKVSGFGKIAVQQCHKTSWVKKKKKKKYILVRSKKYISRGCGIYFSGQNSGMLLKRRLTPVGRRVTGYITKETRRRRIIPSFVKII